MLTMCKALQCVHSATPNCDTKKIRGFPSLLRYIVCPLLQCPHYPQPSQRHNSSAKALRFQQSEDFLSHTVNHPQSEGTVISACAVPQAPTKHVRCKGSNIQSRGGTSIIPSLDRHRPCHVPLQPFPLPRLPCRLVSRVQTSVCAPQEVLCSD